LDELLREYLPILIFLIKIGIPWIVQWFNQSMQDLEGGRDLGLP